MYVRTQRKDKTLFIFRQSKNGYGMGIGNYVSYCSKFAVLSYQVKTKQPIRKIMWVEYDLPFGPGIIEETPEQLTI